MKIPPKGLVVCAFRTETRRHGYDIVIELRQLTGGKAQQPEGVMVPALTLFYAANELVRLTNMDPVALLRKAQHDGMLGIFRDFPSGDA